MSIRLYDDLVVRFNDHCSLNVRDLALGVIRITGTPSTTADVQSDTTITVTNSSGDTMQVVTIAANRTLPLIASNGETDIIFGATLEIAANQADGMYTGTYNVTINYL